MKNDAGEMSMNDDSKRKAWLEHYPRLLNAEFDWDPNHLSDESPVERPPVLERIVDGLIRQVVSNDDSQFGFVPGRGTTDAIFVVRQLQEKYLAANKRLYMAFVDLEKAFDRVPRKVIWWALRKLGVDEWIVRLVQGMYSNERSRIRVGEGYSEEFEVKVGVHQGSVLSQLLFIIVLEALSAVGSHGWTSMQITLLS